MTQRKTSSTPGISLNPEGVMSAGNKIEYKTDDISNSHRDIVIKELNQQKIHTILNQYGSNSNNTKTHYLTQFLALAIV
jgi:hypothetical protein